MNTRPSRYQVSLDHKGLFDIADASAVSLRCEHGSVWLTLDNDPRDVVLQAGEQFSTDEHRRALVYALSDATLTLQARTQPETPSTRVSFDLRPVAA